MSKGLSFAGLMDLGTLDALKVSSTKTASRSKVSPGTERITLESKENVAAATGAPAREQVITYPQPC